MMIHAVFFFCSVPSILCTVLLFRSYRQNKTRLLLWSSLCFAALALANALLYFDLAIWPAVDLSLYRNLLTFVGLLLLVYGLITDT